MFNYYSALKAVAKSNRALNMFIASKEINGINLFDNNTDFSKIQEEYINLLYLYNSIYQDISIHKISKKVLENDIYEEAYLYWKKERGFDYEKDNSNKITALALTAGNTITFPKGDK